MGGGVGVGGRVIVEALILVLSPEWMFNELLTGASGQHDGHVS